MLTVTKITSLDEVLELPGAETTSWVRELEGPEEVGGLLEVGADSVDLVDKILDGHNAELAQGILDDFIVGESNALLVDLAIATLVDKLTNVLQVGVSVGDERLNNSQHLDGSLGDLDEDAIVDLEKTEELQGLALLRVDLVDTKNPISFRSMLNV